MHAIGSVIRLDNDDDFRPIWSHEWHVNEIARTVHYRPGKLTFLIDYTPPPEGEWIKPTGLSARLVDACDGADVPPADVLRQIAKDAITAFVVTADVCQSPIDEEQIPFRQAPKQPMLLTQQQREQTIAVMLAGIKGRYGIDPRDLTKPSSNIFPHLNKLLIEEAQRQGLTGQLTRFDIMPDDKISFETVPNEPGGEGVNFTAAYLAGSPS